MHVIFRNHKEMTKTLLTPANRSKHQQHIVFHYPSTEMAKQLTAIYQSNAMSCLVKCGHFLVPIKIYLPPQYDQ